MYCAGDICIAQEITCKSIGQDTSPCTTAPPPPRLQGDQNFLIQKNIADPKMRCHQNSFRIWRVTESILGKKNVFFFINHIIFFIFQICIL